MLGRVEDCEVHAELAGFEEVVLDDLDEADGQRPVPEEVRGEESAGIARCGV